MKPTSAKAMRCRSTATHQRGSFLLEALIAILIFSLGTLGLVGLQAQSIRHVNDAQYQGEAVYLANSVLSKMWSDDRATLTAKYTGSAGSGGAGYMTLLELEKDLLLPGVSDTSNPPQIDVVNGPSTTSVQVTVTIWWQLPGEATPHNYRTTGVVGAN
jgi:type IV pilus assembly protein PilV